MKKQSNFLSIKGKFLSIKSKLFSGGNFASIKSKLRSVFNKAYVLRIILFVLISLVIGFSVYSWNAKSLTGNVLPMPFGVGVAVVMSGSMEPALSVDDVIFVTEADEYNVGDFVVYQDGYSLVVHELIEKLDDGMVITKGMANNVEDDPISIDSIRGKVRFSIPAVGLIVTALKSTVATVIILGVAVYLVILSYKKERQSESEKLDAIREEIQRLKEQSSNNQ